MQSLCNRKAALVSYSKVDGAASHEVKSTHPIMEDRDYCSI